VTFKQFLPPEQVVSRSNIHVVLRASAAFLLCLAFIAGCAKEESSETGEHAYVASSQTDELALRDRVAAVYNKVVVVKNGDRVTVLDRSANKRFVLVRTESGKQGWIEQRYLIGQDVYDAFKKLAQENANAPAQATAVLPRPLNLHVQPFRTSETLYQLKEGSKVELLRRTSTLKTATSVEPPHPAVAKPEPAKTEKVPGKPAPGKTSAPTKSSAAKKPAPTPAAASPEATPEDWWLVRDDQKHVGWLRGRTIDIEAPLEIAQYAEGQRIVGSFVVSTVEDDKGQKVPQYAVLLTEAKDGLPFDFNQLRVFTWNRKRSRYETAFRDRFEGELPFTVAKADFGKEGVLPTFTAHYRDANGNIQERKYKMNGVIVRRIVAEGQAPAGKASSSSSKGRRPS
jgi:hypothetical protein